jgi:hypothetical protein
MSHKARDVNYVLHVNKQKYGKGAEFDKFNTVAISTSRNHICTWITK